MSNAAVKREFVDPLLRSLGNNKLVREAVEAQRGQVVLLEDYSALAKTIEATIGQKAPAKVLKSALGAAQEQALALHRRYTATKLGKRKFNIFKKKLPDIPHLNTYTIGKELFMVSNFNSSIRSIKNAMLKVVEQELVLSKEERLSVSKELHRGHGESGLAISQVQVAKGIQRAANLSEKMDVDLFFKNLNHYISEVTVLDPKAQKTLADQVKELRTQYTNVVTKSGDLRADYFSVVTLQYSGDNQYDRILEQALVSTFRSFVEKDFTAKVATVEGSPSIKDKVGSMVLDTLGEVKGSKTTGDRKSFKVKTVGTVGVKGKAKKDSKPIIKKTRGELTQVRRRKALAGVAAQPLNLIALLNQRLPAAIRANMGEPALVNRTGRFADSVRVTDVTTTNQGYPSIGYTYQLNPYQVFEIGTGRAPWATQGRDPRILIDRTIREIAAEFAIGRFYTRRTQ